MIYGFRRVEDGQITWYVCGVDIRVMASIILVSWRAGRVMGVRYHGCFMYDSCMFDVQIYISTKGFIPHRKEYCH